MSLQQLWMYRHCPASTSSSPFLPAAPLTPYTFIKWDENSLNISDPMNNVLEKPRGSQACPCHQYDKCRYSCFNCWDRVGVQTHLCFAWGDINAVLILPEPLIPTPPSHCLQLGSWEEPEWAGNRKKWLGTGRVGWEQAEMVENGNNGFGTGKNG